MCCCFFTSLPLKKILRLAGLPSCGILHLLHPLVHSFYIFYLTAQYPLLPVGIPKKKSTSLHHSAQLSSVKRNPFCDQDSSLDRNGHRAVVGCVIWHTEWGWAILCYCIQISPALPDPNLADGYITLLGGAGAFMLYPHITHCHCHCAKTHKTLSGQISAPLLAFPLRVHCWTLADRRSCFAVGSPTLDASGSFPCFCSSPLFLTLSPSAHSRDG